MGAPKARGRVPQATATVRGSYPHRKGYPIIGGLEISGRVAKLGPEAGIVGAGDLARDR